MKTVTRKRFLELGACAVPAAIVASAIGCGDDDPDDDDPDDDDAAGVEATYMLSLEAGHVHEVTVTPDMFGELQQGEMVMTMTAEDATGHQHPVMIACA
jgi:hypothetical protein